MSVSEYCRNTGKKKPEHVSGNYNVLKVKLRQEYQEVMCLSWMSKEAAEWYVEYYNTTYPNMKFTLVGYD